MKKIGIIGFGWLGEPLGHHLKEAGYTVVGSCTSEQKKERLWADGLHAVYFKLSLIRRAWRIRHFFRWMCWS
ncbi:NAD(P)-binding domain-containing protein [Nitritalea halalkaliphila]|nr:NAD(P)-binding domain-containing protein [Nitritalea halalkaliphila]